MLNIQQIHQKCCYFLFHYIIFLNRYPSLFNFVNKDYTKKGMLVTPPYLIPFSV